VSPQPGPSDQDTFVRRHLRRNVASLGGDYVFYVIGLAFASQSTVLAAFANHLGAPNVLIGAIPAVSTLGWLLPALFVAGHTEALERKLPFVLKYTAWERAPYLVLAVLTFVVADRAPGLMLALLLVVLFLTTGIAGILVPAWTDIVGRAVPVTLRGRFFAGCTVLSSLGGLGASVVTASVLGAIPPPVSYGVCFLGSAACMVLSYIALRFMREPPAASPPAPSVPLRAYLARIPDLLRRNRNMAWFLVARSFGALGVMSAGFFTVYALRVLGAPAWQVGVFTTLLLAGNLAANVIFGWLADRFGHRIVFAVGSAAALVANAVALASPSLDAFRIVFVLDGVYDAAISVSALNILLEMAPTEEERPTYVGLGRTALAPVAFAGPLAAGVLADTVGFVPVFALAMGSSLVALILFGARVHEPRGGIRTPLRP
jgi:MFS family permease